MTQLYYGVVESRNDPLRLGRCKIRIVGVHTDNNIILPTDDLPWAWPIQDITSAALSGIGRSATGLVEGSTVVVTFADDAMQIPMIIGSLAGIPSGQEAESVDSIEFLSTLQSEAEITPPLTPPENNIILKNGEVIKKSEVVDKTQVLLELEAPYIGQLTKSQVNTLKEVIAKKVSGSNYNAENSLGFLGKYQFDARVLEDTGYIQKGSYARIKNNLKVVTNNTLPDEPSNWTGKNGVTDKTSFKSNSKVQDELMDIMLKRNYKILSKMDVVSSATPPEKLAGALTVAHLLGAVGARDYIKRGLNNKDAYGTSAKSYYQMGYKAISGKKTDEDPTPSNINKPAIDYQYDPNSSKSKYDIQKPKASKKSPKGFADPNGRYPLEGHLNEVDTPRVAAVQKVSQSIVGEKEAEITQNVPIANSKVNWNQSPIPYNAKYPFNHAYTSESGHVLEFDDTPGSERVNIHHMSGTFTEVDSEGNQTNKVKGIKTIIVEDDEYLNIQGSGHVAIVGDLSVRIGGQCQIEIIGDANVNVKGNLTAKVKGDTSLKVLGNVKQEVIGDYSILAKTFNVTTSGAINMRATGNINADGANIWMNSGQSSTVSPLLEFPEYSPTVRKPAPFNRDEEMSIHMEDDTSADAEKITSTEVNASGPITIEAADDTPIKKVEIVSTECDFGTPTYSMQLTKNYTLQSLCVDGPFAFDGQNGLSGEAIACNLKKLAINVIEPLKEKYSHLGFKINSCFRLRKNGKSLHELGMAVDIGFSKIRGKSNDREEYFKLAQEIKSLVPYDQLLLEYRTNGSVWIHISFNSDNLRRQVLTLNNDKTIAQGLVQLGQVA